MIYAIHKETKEHVPNPSMSQLGLARDWRIMDADADGWIEWHGGECPFPEKHPVEVTRRDGEKLSRESSRTICWSGRGDEYDIIAYRPILNEPKEPGAPEWDGEGLPPVGAECEVSNCDQLFAWCKVKYMGSQLCVVDHKTHSDQHYHLSIVKFRPIRTAAQRAEDEAVEAIRDSAESCNALLESEWEAVYRAIRDGKIPGVKLED